MKLYVIAGEASGDLHGAHLIRALRKEDDTINIRCWGGNMMESEGADLVKHYRDLAFMGFAEVIMNLRTILRNIDFCKADIANYQPDAVVLIDYPGFNMRIAAYCKKIGIPVLYYISPQIWAWKEKRVHKIKRDVRAMFVILPFEKAFFARHGMEVQFVGHPLLDVIEGRQSEGEKLRSSLGLSASDKLVALLPGSRKQEISTMLPVMLKAAAQQPDVTFVIAGAPGQEKSFYESISGSEKHEILFGQTYALFEAADAGMVTSGTATLEAALFKMPLVVCYKGGVISYEIAKRLVKVKYISLINLILDREAVPELIQSEFNVKNLDKKLHQVLFDEAFRKAQKDSFETLHEVLGGPGAAKRTARGMLKTLNDLKHERGAQS